MLKENYQNVSIYENIRKHMKCSKRKKATVSESRLSSSVNEEDVDLAELEA
jgi:ribosomal protein L18E